MEVLQTEKTVVTTNCKKSAEAIVPRKNLERLKEHREELLESIRDGRYKPSSVCRVEIPKDNGGVRKLGIPTVIDRIIQQAIAEVLIPIYEPKFSDGSYGYRPHRSAKDAILKVKNGQMKATNMQHVLICQNISIYSITNCL